MALQNSRRSLAPVLIWLAFALAFGPVRDGFAAAREPSLLDQYSRAADAVARVIKPSVVFIEVTTKTEASDIHWLPGFPGTPPRETHGEASGVIISPTGDVLTNAHVADGAKEITVSTPTGQSYPATVVALDKIRDLAVIRIKPAQPLPAAVLGNAESSPAGSWVMAVGFPFGAELDPALRYDPSVTIGAISALHRDVETGILAPILTDLIQTDAAINPGSSGGPLVNSRGEVIGINEGIFTTGSAAGNIGVGFAVPIDETTQQIVRTLQSGHSVVRGQLGVAVVPLTPARKRQTGAEYGAMVRSVTANSPAARAGVQTGDVIVNYNGQRVNATDDLIKMIYASPPGATASIRVLRGRQLVSLSATIAQLTREDEQPTGHGGLVGAVRRG